MYDSRTAEEKGKRWQKKKLITRNNIYRDSSTGMVLCFMHIIMLNPHNNPVT